VLVNKCREIGVDCTAVPGPSAVINALVLSGLPTARFCFLGFLPRKENDIRKLIAKYKDFEGTKVVYDSPLRVRQSVSIIREVMGSTSKIKVIREMTKKFEEVSSDDLVANIKGEVVIVYS
jgi:16S rRNA (cytidine1402-2'-O)-methyltransferase